MAAKVFLLISWHFHFPLYTSQPQTSPSLLKTGKSWLNKNQFVSTFKTANYCETTLAFHFKHDSFYSKSLPLLFSTICKIHKFYEGKVKNNNIYIHTHTYIYIQTQYKIFFISILRYINSKQGCIFQHHRKSHWY